MDQYLKALDHILEHGENLCTISLLQAKISQIEQAQAQ